jgi:hypothetical protein
MGLNQSCFVFKQDRFGEIDQKGCDSDVIKNFNVVQINRSL